MKIFLAALLIIISVDLYAQKNTEIIAPSPTVAELGKYGLVPVGLFSGTAQYNIPLYELKTQNLSLPISLSYSSNGLVVDQVSSWVGHSWSLNAGGVITRSVRGLPDNPSYSLPYPNGVDTNPTLLLNFLETNAIKCDVEPDIYAFNFMGYQGKFFIDTDNKVYMTPYESVKIEIDANKNFIITTPDGVKYSFETPEIFFCTSACEDFTQFTSAWYLTKIEHPAGDKINFNYSPTYIVDYNSGISETIDRVKSTSGECGYGNSGSDLDGEIRASASSSQTCHLVSITTNGSGSIKFRGSKDRLDLVDDYKLNSITIFNNESDSIRSFSFDFSFEHSNVNYNPLADITYKLNSDHTEELNWRMFLKKLTIKDFKGIKDQEFSFEYNNLDNLPRRLSLAQDYFGYFNGVTNNNHFVPSEKIPAFYLPIFSNISGNRHPNGQISVNGTLKKITYPTGGYTNIYYEPHQSTFGEIGGCRVLKTESYDNNNPVPNVKEYTYSEGNLSGLPSYFRTYDIQRYSGCDHRCISYYGSITSSSLYSINHNGQYPVVYAGVSVSDGINFQNGGTRYGFRVASDDVALPLGSGTGGIVIPLPKGNQGWSNGTKESEETVKRLINGTLVTLKREEFGYNYTESRNKKIRYCLSRNINNNGYAYDNCVIHLPVYDLIGYDVVKYSLISQWCPLTAKTTTIFDSDGQNPVETVINYTYSDSIHAQVTKEDTKDSQEIEKIKTYKYSTDYPSTSVTCEVDRQICLAAAVAQRDQMLAQCNQISDPTARATCVSFHTSIYDNAVAICENNYNNCSPSDQEIITEMQNKHIINAVIEEQILQLKGSVKTLTGGIVNKFKIENGLILPSEKYELEINEPSSILTTSSINSSGELIFHPNYSKKLTYDKYDTKGNILQYHQRDNINTSFLWSYNTTLPIIKGDNVTYDILNAAVIAAGATNPETFWSGFNNIATNTAQQTLWRNFNTALRNKASLANTQITTFTYKPLIGLTSQTDPNGKTTYYEYDDFGRLKFTKDDQGKILKKFDYHYKQ